MNNTNNPPRLIDRGLTYLEGIHLVIAVLMRPKWAMSRASQGRHALVAWMVWLGSCVVPSILMLQQEDLSNPMHVGAIVIVTAIPGAIVLGVLSALLNPDGREQGRSTRVVLGYSATPHLLLASYMAWVGMESFGPVFLTGVPGGVGIGGAAVFAFFDLAGEARAASILWYVPPILSFWSGYLFVVGMGEISQKSWQGTAAGYGAAVAFVSFLSGGFWFGISMVFIFLSSLLSFSGTPG